MECILDKLLIDINKISQSILPVEEEDGRVGGLQQQMNDTVPYASQERQELIEVKIFFEFKGKDMTYGTE